VKKAARNKKRSHRLKRKFGFFESPLVIGIFNLIPIVIVVIGTFWLAKNVYVNLKSSEVILGEQTSVNYGVKVNIKIRINELKEILKIVDSEEVREEIKRLESL